MDSESDRPHGTVRKLEQEVRILREREQEGESGATPLLAMAGVLPLLIAAFLLLLGAAMAAYYLA
jgi:UPF0716 family protein affecting phage T7 exclusion